MRLAACRIEAEHSTRTMQRMEIADGRTGDGIFTEPNAAPTCTRYRENDLERSELALAGERLKSPRDLLRARYAPESERQRKRARRAARPVEPARFAKKRRRTTQRPRSRRAVCRSMTSIAFESRVPATPPRVIDALASGATGVCTIGQFNMT